MTIKQIQKIVKEEISTFRPDLIFGDDYFFYSVNKRDIIFFSVKKFGVVYYLNLTISIYLEEIEKKWILYKKQLGLQDGLFDYSFYNSFNHVDRNKFATLEDIGIRILEDEIWIRQTVRDVVVGYYLPFAEKLNDISYCDQLINKDLEITDEICKFSPIDGLPFRKIFIAEEACNPRLHEIKLAMRKWVNDAYEHGKKVKFEKLCRIKPVFETLFGTED